MGCKEQLESKLALNHAYVRAISTILCVWRVHGHTRTCYTCTGQNCAS